MTRMKKQRGFTLSETIAVFVLLFWLVSYSWNAVKLVSCDFASPYKCEVVHGVGVIAPPLSVVTVWFDDDED